MELGRSNSKQQQQQQTGVLAATEGGGSSSGGGGPAHEAAFLQLLQKCMFSSDRLHRRETSFAHPSLSAQQPISSRPGVRTDCMLLALPHAVTAICRLSRHQHRRY
jgi:hypothetical protein